MLLLHFLEGTHLALTQETDTRSKNKQTTKKNPKPQLNIKLCNTRGKTQEHLPWNYKEPSCLIGYMVAMWYGELLSVASSCMMYGSELPS